MNRDNSEFTTEHRNAAVLRILKAAGGPMTPTSIATMIGESWCCYGKSGCSAPISPVLKRIKAVRVGHGRWSKPEGS